MIITQATLDAIRIRFNSLLDQGFDCTQRITTANSQRALEVAVREALSTAVPAMPLSDAEELKVQEMEKAVSAMSEELQKVAAPILKLIRTRHTKRVVTRTPGQILHESFHTDLHTQGESKYEKGCWHTLSPERRKAWEAAGRQLALAVVRNETDLETPGGDKLRVGAPPSFQWRTQR